MLNIILRNVLIVTTMLTLSAFASAQTTYTTIGNITFGSDGSTAQTIGGTTFIIYLRLQIGTVLIILL